MINYPIIISSGLFFFCQFVAKLFSISSRTSALSYVMLLQVINFICYRLFRFGTIICDGDDNIIALLPCGTMSSPPVSRYLRVSPVCARRSRLQLQ